MANGEYERHQQCSRRNYCELFRSFSKKCAIAAEEGQSPSDPSPDECLGILARGEECSRFSTLPTDDEGEQPSSGKFPPYTLNDGLND